MAKKDKIEQYLKLRNGQMGQVFPTISPSDLELLHLTSDNPYLDPETVSDTVRFEQALNASLPSGKVGIGGFMEIRTIYRRSLLYSGDEPRCVHLGVDVWAAANTPLFAPWRGIVHSFQDNQGFGNYGPTIILEHQTEEGLFFTLYGHLSLASLEKVSVGQAIEKNEKIGELGPYPENGDWPPHLHFQAMTDLLGNAGDFPGVIAPSQRYLYESICIDPMLLLTFK